MTNLVITIRIQEAQNIIEKVKRIIVNQNTIQVLNSMKGL